MPSLMMVGMHGLGDNIYTRAVVRQYLDKFDEIWLETPWPQLFHDMPSRLHLVKPRTDLRTQLKNIDRSGVLFETVPVNVDEVRRVWYFTSEIVAGKWDSVPNAMLGNMGCAIPGDYRLPIPSEWRHEALGMLPRQQKPILIYRPLTFRLEWRATAARNPNPAAFIKIFEAIREKFFVVGIADIDGRNEVMVSDAVSVDKSFYRGQLGIERLLGLFSAAACVYSAPGFAIAAAQAVGTPSITVFGGYESSRAYRSSAIFAPALMIDPISPCDCFNELHLCDKTIDVDAAKAAVDGWLSQERLVA